MKKMTKWIVACAVCVLGSVPTAGADMNITPEITMTPQETITPAPEQNEPVITPEVTPTPIPEVKNGWITVGKKLDTRLVRFFRGIAGLWRSLGGTETVSYTHLYKANEKFSGRGHARHICKECQSLPEDVKADMVRCNEVELSLIHILLRWMRKEGKLQPFIIMTDYAEVHTAVESMKLGSLSSTSCLGM